MSQLASKIAKSSGVKPLDTIPKPVTQPGLRPVCYPLYGPGDLEDLLMVEAVRVGREWHEVQAAVDASAGVINPLPLDKFRRHWRRRCSCWPKDLRL